MSDHSAEIARLVEITRAEEGIPMPVGATVLIWGLDADGDEVWSAAFLGQARQATILGVIELVKHSVLEWTP